MIASAPTYRKGQGGNDMTMSRFDRAVISHCLPGLFLLAKELRATLITETHKDSGQLKRASYSSLDDETGVIEVGWDETGMPNPHGYYYNMGTSKRDGDPAIQRTVYRHYRNRNGDGS